MTPGTVDFQRGSQAPGTMNQAPTGADEATLIRWDMNNQQAQLDSLADAFKLNGGKLGGLPAEVLVSDTPTEGDPRPAK